MKPRQPRKNVLVSARLSCGTSWADTSIVNVSARGMGLQTLRVPRRGTYVEIRRGHVCIVAQVVWTEGQRFGVRTQDDVDLGALCSKARSSTSGRAGDRGEKAESLQWKRIPKRYSEIAERNRLLGRAAEFAWLGIGGAAASFLVVHAMHQTLDKAGVRIVQAIAGSQSAAAH